MAALVQPTNGQTSDVSHVNQYAALFQGGYVFDVINGYNAAGDGVSDDATEIGNALSDAGPGLTVLPNASYLTSALTTLIYSKIEGFGSLLQPFANSMTVLTLTTGSQQLQSSDFQLVRNLRIDGFGKTGITGIATDGGAATTLAHGIIENVVITNTDVVGLNLGNAQFFRSYNVRISLGNGIGLLIANNATSGGANSHDHYGLHATDKQVGVLVNGTRAATPAWSNNFYNPQVIGNSVCGMAFFHANATLYGGAPEFNATGAATVSADGQTVKRSSMYVVNSFVRVANMNVGEATATPCFLLETNSVLVLADLSGYSIGSGLLVQADSTSVANLEGTFANAGVVQNVGAWPDALILNVDGAQSILYGEPIHSVDPTLAVLYAHPAPAIVGQGANPPTMSYVEDADLGYCRQAAFSSTAGSVNNDLASITVAGAASKDSVISVLVKSSVDTQIGFNLHDGAAYNAITSEQIFLKAGKVTRLVMGKRSIAAGTWTLIWYPMGTDAPTIKFANLQVYQGPTGTQVTTQDIAKIISKGAFSPGVTRDTTTNLALQSADVNAKGKYPGKQVWNSTTNRVVFAAGGAVGDVWKDGVNATVHTPV